MYDMWETSVYGESEQANGTTITEALDNAGYNWNAYLRPLHAIVPDPAPNKADTFVDVPNHFAVVRDTDNAVFAVVGDRYEVIQHREAFSVIDTLVKRGEVEIDRVQALNGGARMLVVTKGEDLQIAGEPVANYQAWLNGCDGKVPVVMIPTPMRKFCSNIFNFKVDKTVKDSYRIRHTRYSPLKLMEMQREMFGVNSLEAELAELMGKTGLTPEEIELQKQKAEKEMMADASRAMTTAQVYNERVAEELEKLTAKKINSKGFEQLLKKLIPEPEVESKMADTLRDSRRAEIRSIYVSDQNLNNIRGTALGFLNAVTQYTQHAKPYKSNDRKVHVLLSADALGQQAFDLARRVR